MQARLRVHHREVHVQGCHHGCWVEGKGWAGERPAAQAGAPPRSAQSLARFSCTALLGAAPSPTRTAQVSQRPPPPAAGPPASLYCVARHPLLCPPVFAPVPLCPSHAGRLEAWDGTGKRHRQSLSTACCPTGDPLPSKSFFLISSTPRSSHLKKVPPSQSVRTNAQPLAHMASIGDAIAIVCLL